MLEECCYDFTAQWLPELLEERQWDCPEAIELNKWTHTIVKRLAKLPSHYSQAFAKDDGTSLANILISINKLRHSAVHRLHTTAKGILEMIHSAARFAKVLRDLTREQQLEDMHHELEGKIRALELNKNFLERKLEQEMQEIARQRSELDEREKGAVVTMLREDKDYSSLIGVLLTHSVKQIFDESKHKEFEGKDAERSSDCESEELEGQEPDINHRTTDPIEPNLSVEASPGPTHGTALKRELKSGYESVVEAGPGLPRSADLSTEGEAYHKEGYQFEVGCRLSSATEPAFTLNAHQTPRSPPKASYNGSAVVDATLGSIPDAMEQNKEADPDRYKVAQEVHGM